MIILFSIGFHILIVLTLTTSEGINKSLNQFRLSKLYKIFAIPGPFFSEDRINNTVMLFARTKNKSEWSEPVHIGSKEFNAYHANYFRYDQLSKSGIGRFLARQVVYDKKQFPDSSRFFRELNQFMKNEHLVNVTDSIQLLFVQKKFESSDVDTLFNYSYALK